MKTALVTIANGPLYHKFAKRMFASADKYFPAHIPFVWTDAPQEFWGWGRTHYAFESSYRGYPDSTLYRYHEILKAIDVLKHFDQIFYSDADMEWVAPAGDIFSEGITATHHPGFFAQNQHGSPETRRESEAYLTGNRAYYCGGFNGGAAWAYLKMASIIQRKVDMDLARGIVAVWHDESHFNRYMHDNPPDKVLSPSYCFPEGYRQGYGWRPEDYPAILVALEKNGRRS